MDEDEFAKSLLAHERREWQDPEKIVSRIGIGEGMVVADLACGPGFFVLPISNAVGPEGLVYAVDRSSIMLGYLGSLIKKAKQISPQTVKILQSDVSSTRIPSGSCDIVLFANILHDVEDVERFVFEVKRIAKRDSKIADIDWRDVDNGFGPPLESRMTEVRSKEVLESNGLQFVRNFDAGPYHYGLVFRKA